MAEDAGTFIVPTMQMTSEDLQALHEERLTPYTKAKIERDAQQIIEAQQRIAPSSSSRTRMRGCKMHEEVFTQTGSSNAKSHAVFAI